MGNTIRNYEKKKRKDQKEAYRELQRDVAEFMVERMGSAVYQRLRSEVEDSRLLNKPISNSRHYK